MLIDIVKALHHSYDRNFLSFTFYLECFYELTDAHGTFKSPNYPERYAPNLDCSYVISAAKDHTITVIFEVIDIESSGDCAYDFVEVYSYQYLWSSCYYKSFKYCSEDSGFFEGCK